MTKTPLGNLPGIRRNNPVVMLIIGLWSIGLSALHAQNTPLDALWSRIETRIDQRDVDTTYQFIVDDIKAHCGGDVNCLLLVYDSIRLKLERKFNLKALIKLTHAFIRTAEEQGLIEKMAQGHHNLSRYYDALRQIRQALIHVDLALQYFEQSGNKRELIKSKFWKINLTSTDSDDDPPISVLESLVHEAIAEKDSILAGKVLLYLLRRSVQMDTPEKAAFYFDLFEHTMNPDIKGREKKIWGDFWHGKGEFMQKNGNYLATKKYYEKALAIFQEIGDPWRELNTIIILVETDWALDNRKEAKNRLDQALQLSAEIKSEDLFVKVFKIATEIAEAEGRYADALIYLKKMNAAQTRIDETGDKKIVDNYALEVENKNKVLELQQSKDRLKYTTAIIILILLLAAGLLIGFYRQRKNRRALAAQNALIQEQADQLKSLDLAKSRFFANVSHELRTPLTLLTSPIKTLLKDRQLTEKQTQLLRMAERSGQQLGQLVNEILDLRKLEMGKMTVSTEPTELHPYFQTCFAQFESLAEQKQIDYTLVLDVPDGTPAKLDREKCRQILFNLLSNAFKFTPAGGKIETTIQTSENRLHIRVTDSGAGIHPDDLPHVFDRYFQSKRPDKPAEGGTGIGLALCREYAQLFGGHIAVNSNLGKGATFTVSFPIALYDDVPAVLGNQGADEANHFSQKAENAHRNAEPNGHATDTRLAPNSDDHNRPFILLAEDNPDLREYIRFILKDKYHVVTAENGQEALKVMSDELSVMSQPETHNPSLITPTTHNSSLITHNSPLITPALVLSDLMMPVMDGYQLLETLKSNDATRHIPFIMLTARAEVQDKLKALRIGVDDYLTKPFDEEELLARIENLLKNQAARRAAAVTDGAMPASEPATAPIMSQPDREWLEGFEAYVQKHYAGDLLSVASLAHAFAMSESTLLRQLKRLTGLSPQQYIQEVRLNEARRLLENRAYNSIAQVASKVGYDDARTFTRSFKQRFGKLPSEVMEG